MPWSPPSSPTIGDPYTLGSLTWEWNGTGWATVPNTASGPNTFQSAVLQDYYETLVISGANPVSNMTGVLLTYL